MPEELKSLGGEANPDSWYFENFGASGPLPSPVGHTVPLLTHDSEGQWKLLGTGFYVGNPGLFVTARHVVEPVLNGGEQIFPLVALHLHSDIGLFGPSEIIVRPVVQCWLGEPADIALGVAIGMTNQNTGRELLNRSWVLTWRQPALNSRAGTYAFPFPKDANDNLSRTRCCTLHPNVYVGQVQEHGDYRDSVRIPFPFYQVSFRIHHAASGGPVFGENGAVIGVNCSEMEGQPGIAYATQIRCLAGAFVDNVQLETQLPAGRVTFRELVAAGVIRVMGINNDLDIDNSTSSGRVVHLNLMPTAVRPEIDIVQYC